MLLPLILLLEKQYFEDLVILHGGDGFINSLILQIKVLIIKTNTSHLKMFLFLLFKKNTHTHTKFENLTWN